MLNYEIEYFFNHYYTNEKIYRVKIIYQNGGVVYQVLNEEQLNKLKLGEY